MGSTVACDELAGRASRPRAISQGIARRIWAGGAAALVLLAVAGAPAAQAAMSKQDRGSLLPQPTGQWASYLHGNERSGFNSAEQLITPVSAPQLAQRWSYTTSQPISAQPIEANNLVYFGSWDGYERALTPSGHLVWSTYLGRTNAPSCGSTVIGVASTPFVTQASPANLPTARSVLYVGGGDGQIYALDAHSGAVIWSTRLGPSPATFIWSSPLVYNGSVYIGVSSLGDCPLVQGQLVQLNATTGALQHTFAVVPTGCTGGGVWGSPALDAHTGIIYFATGNGNVCSTSETYATALVAVRAAGLTLVSSWQIPPSQQVFDGDFGSTPTLFTATIGGVSRSLLGIVGKNGLYYAFDRTN
ncbi:MAG: PQQ-binding-like beta-propeller repeat protein, partial [Ktedonobacterales bacterium]